MDFKETEPARMQSTPDLFSERRLISLRRDFDTIATGRRRAAKASGKVVTGAGRV